MRKTKIVCTLGPASESEDILRKLMIEGMDVARFNFSHGTHEEQLEKLNRVKKLREELNLPVAALLDTKGPEIRLKTFENGKAELKQGGKFILTTVISLEIRKLHPLPIRICRRMSKPEAGFYWMMV